MTSASQPSPYVLGELPPAAACGRSVRLRPGGDALTARAIASGGWRSGGRILDLGCGDGGSVATLRRMGFRAVGIDPAAPATPSSASLIRGRAEHLPFASGSFDGVLAECSLSVTGDPETALAEVARVLRPGGSLVMTDMYARGSSAEPAPCGCLSGLVSSGEWTRRLEAAGLRITTREDHSDSLRQLIGRVLLEHGTLAPLWGECSTEGNMEEAARRLRPGYLLMVAALPVANDGEG